MQGRSPSTRCTRASPSKSHTWAWERSAPRSTHHVVYGADFFDANRHPEIAFSSDDVLLSDDGTARVTGQLTIRGITKPFTSTGTYRPSVEDPYGNLRAGIELTATVDRRDWGMDWQAPLPKGGDALGYAVALHTHVELVKQNGSQ